MLRIKNTISLQCCKHLFSAVLMNILFLEQCGQLPKPAVKPRARLAVLDAVEIFKLRESEIQATSVANMYGMSEKAIRDIWTARTWARETWHLEPSRDMVLKQAGRPKGSADSKPRRTKARVNHRRTQNIVNRPSKRQPVDNNHQLSENAYFALADSFAVADAAQSQFRCAVQPSRAGDARYDVNAPAPNPGGVKAPALPSLDEQLGAWDLGACSPESWDPFERDWGRARAGLAMCVV